MSLLFVALLIMGQVDAGVHDAGIPDAGVPSVGVLAPLYASCPAITADVPFAFPVKRTGSFIEELPADAGATSDFYLPYPRAQRTSCRLAACETRVVELDTWGRGLELPWWAAATIGVLAAGFGAWGMWEVCSKLPVLCGSR